MKDLVECLKRGEVMLFIGAGISMNLGLPSFNGLIDDLAEKMGYESDILRIYGDNLALAEFYQIKKKSITELIEWLNIYWNQGRNIEDSKIHKLILQLKCNIIYTTNYDNWIEKAHEINEIKYQKISNMSEIKNIADGKVQIIKYHGDLSDEKSIVLTESSYFDRMEFDNPIDIKFRYDSIRKSVLYLGYSLNDINIRYLLYKIHKLWEQSVFGNDKPKSFIFLTDPNPVQKKILEKRGIVVFESKNSDRSKGLETFLEELVKKAFMENDK